jgi:hypothetical protein
MSILIPCSNTLLSVLATSIINPASYCMTKTAICEQCVVPWASRVQDGPAAFEWTTSCHSFVKILSSKVLTNGRTEHILLLYCTPTSGFQCVEIKHKHRECEQAREQQENKQVQVKDAHRSLSAL